jgi:proteic killer suppression protein
MNDICIVRLSKRVIKSLKKLPVHIIIKLQAWIDEVINSGLNEARKITSYHDEQLKGDRIGQRSIRLNKAYRAIYIVEKDKNVRFVEILEITKHEY